MVVTVMEMMVLIRGENYGESYDVCEDEWG